MSERASESSVLSERASESSVLSERASESSVPGTGARLTVGQMLDNARARLNRLRPVEASRAVAGGALLVDIRPDWQRSAEGSIPDALIIERNHLEWRADPTSDARIPEAVDHDVSWVVICSEGYTSSLAAASLQDLGLHRATDVIGGFHAWKAAGLRTNR